MKKQVIIMLGLCLLLASNIANAEEVAVDEHAVQPISEVGVQEEQVKVNNEGINNAVDTEDVKQVVKEDENIMPIAETQVQEDKAEVNAKTEEAKLTDEIAKRKEIYRSFMSYRLGLNDEQQSKLAKLREDRTQKLRAIKNEIQDNMLEARAIRLSRMSVRMQDERLADVDQRLIVLRGQLCEVRVQSVKDFESILTRKQKRVYRNIRKDNLKYNGKYCKECFNCMF